MPVRADDAGMTGMSLRRRARGDFPQGTRKNPAPTVNAWRERAVAPAAHPLRMARDLLQSIQEQVMTTATLTYTDVRLRDAVMRQLEWDPEVDASAIGVAAHRGTVTLTGFVNTYSDKLEAERAAKRVYGCRAVANEIEVRLKVGRTDVDIAEDAVRALALRNVPSTVQAAVHGGYVTLTGAVPWIFQKLNAAGAVRHLPGVKGMHNHIVVEPLAIPGDVRRRIVTALHLNADVDARHIDVKVSGQTVTLSGAVATWLQNDAAEQAAASVPGIANVDNQIVVESFHEAKSADMDDIC
jgi:osmotically-inducible protein OsmY